MRTTRVVILLAYFALGLGCKKRADPTAIGEAEDKSGTPQVKTTDPVVVAPVTRGRFTIGKTTTFVTGPVDSSGYVDYAAALNEQLSKGVAPEQNANVAIWEILGPNPQSSDTIPPGFFQKLGVPAPPATGDYFIGLRAYTDRHAPGAWQSASEAVSKCSSRPWTADENAIVLGWLHANEKPLAALREAVTRTQYYNPLLPKEADKGLASTVHPGLWVCRELAGAILSRAMLSLGTGNAAEAWQDVLACHRLSRHVGQGGTLIETLVGVAIEQLVCRAEVAFLDRAKLDAQALESCLRDLRALPKPRGLVAQTDLTERIWFLDLIVQMDRQGVANVPVYGADFKKVEHGLRDEDLAGMDWDSTLRTVNTGLDRLTGIFRQKDRATRTRELARFEADGRLRAAEFASGKAAAALKSLDFPEARGRLFGEMLLAVGSSIWGKAMDAIDRNQQVFDTVLVAYALAGYHRVNGRYPDSLGDLAPAYLDAVPIDLFSGNQLIYRPSPTGFLLYSVGVNGIDDAGRGATDQPAGDDLAVRLPLPAKP